MKPTARDKEGKIKITVGGTVSAACTIAGLIIKFSVETCDNLFLKALVIVLFGFALILAVYMINQLLTGYPQFIQFTAYLACLVFYFILSAIVYTKQCAVVPQKTVTEIRQGNIDNSVHTDNHKNYYNARPRQQVLKHQDIAEIIPQLPSKQARILVQYLKSSPADTLLSAQLIKRLTSLGYSDVHLSPATTLPGNLLPGKLTVLTNKIDTFNVYKVIINPQP